MESVRVKLPASEIPPPAPVTCPPEMVRPEMPAVTPLSTVKTLKFDDAPPPSMVKAEAPGPLIVMLAL